ncbi:hypothetical protein R4P48_21510 [Atlantibacter subterranea]|uniref:Uncharacterized protein n=1 Tax=Atlantibacter subterraneus TaxID=255519 RepID=A0ABU4E7Y4_9ENTR|nr:hypothetical protein [Atlantibacter subterranea]MDV7025238.1 hypothetical protein [Atlantibacter subterranea]MDZ5668376.1 hypothetical protein [Atlantibacter hermannii]
MSHVNNIAKAQEKACEAELILRMLESYPDKMLENELSTVITLARRLTEEVHIWLIEEMAKKGKQ